MAEIKPDQLGKELLKILDTYTDEVSEKVSEAVQQTAKESAKTLRAATNGGRWKNYPKGWTATVKQRKGQTTAEVHNKTDYQLTHLLEHGHVIRNGTGRTYGRTREFVHILPVEEKAVDELEKRIKEAIEG